MGLLKSIVFVLLAVTAMPPLAAVTQGQPQTELELAQEVRSRIASAWGGATASLSVAVEDGLVVLDGEAPSPQAAQQAAEVAETTPGVVEVLNRLQPRRP